MVTYTAAATITAVATKKKAVLALFFFLSFCLVFFIFGMEKNYIAI